MKKILFVLALTLCINVGFGQCNEPQEFKLGNVDVVGIPFGFKSPAGYLYGIEVNGVNYIIGGPDYSKPYMECLDTAVQNGNKIHFKGKYVRNKQFQFDEFDDSTICKIIE